MDGNTDGNFWGGSVTSTNSDANAWWQVDLGSSQYVSTIDIFNRTDCCGDRLTDYWVFVSDQPFSPSDTPATLQNRPGTWSRHQTTSPNPSISIPAGAQGRYVRVQLSGTNYLSLAEVRVWGGWLQSFGYDGFGNLVSKTGANSPPLSIGVNPANNQIVGQGYDPNGNQTSYNGLTLTYDSENRLTAAPGVQYAYDSQNKRIWKGTFSGSTMTAQEVYFYGVDGQKLGTYSLYLNTSSPVYLSCTNTNLSVFFGGKRVAVNGVAFVQDRLGSQGKYFPYGEDRGTPLANDQVKFATYTRDSATSLDYADQRYYSNQFGRFMSPDPYRASAGTKDPQSWNRYAYVGGDPVNRVDPNGQDWFDPGDLFGSIYGFIGPGIFPASQDGWTAYFAVIAAQIAAQIAASIEAEKAATSRTPKFLQLTRDCYRVPSNGGPVTREIDYKLYDDSPIPLFYSHAIVWEHLTGDIPLSGPASPSSGAPGTYDDQQSIINFYGQREQHVTQKFSAVTEGGSDLDVFVRGFGQDYGVLDIIKTNDVIYINGNAGGKVDKNGKLIPGSYTPCN